MRFLPEIPPPAQMAHRAGEHLRTLHPPPDCDLPVDGGPFRVWHCSLWSAASRPTAQCRFPDNNYDRQLSRGKPPEDGLRDCYAAGTAICRNSQPRPDDLTQRRRNNDDYATIRLV